MRATWNGKVIADSRETREVDGYVYFPRASVRMDLLREAPKTDGDRQCPHGVQFYDVTDGERSSARCAWSYEAPREAMKKVDHWVGFWDAVQVAT
jgi:uncharacterized protein (DUF427 family)